MGQRIDTGPAGSPLALTDEIIDVAGALGLLYGLLTENDSGISFVVDDTALRNLIKLDLVPLCIRIEAEGKIYENGGKNYHADVEMKWPPVADDFPVSRHG